MSKKKDKETDKNESKREMEREERRKQSYDREEGRGKKNKWKVGSLHYAAGVSHPSQLERQNNPLNVRRRHTRGYE